MAGILRNSNTFTFLQQKNGKIYSNPGLSTYMRLKVNKVKAPIYYKYIEEIEKNIC